VPEAADPAPQTPTRVDPYRNYNFKLSIGNAEAHFTECSSLGVKIEALKYREGGLQQVVRRLPGRVEYLDITLRYGLTSSTELWQWFLTAVEGRVERKHVSIRLMNEAGTEEVLRWDLVDAWPSAWRGAPLDAMGNEVAIESLTLVYESLQRA
jgi:phage tail-like protein